MILDVMDCVNIGGCWSIMAVAIRLLASAFLYLLYVYAAFIAMAYLAYNKFVEHDAIRAVTILVAVLFFAFGVLVVSIFAWIWKWNYPRRQQDDQEPDLDSSSICLRRGHHILLLRFLVAVFIWFVCFVVSTYILWWLGEHNNDNDVSVAIMWVFLFTAVPVLHLFISWKVREKALLLGCSLLLQTTRSSMAERNHTGEVQEQEATILMASNQIV